MEGDVETGTDLFMLRPIVRPDEWKDSGSLQSELIAWEMSLNFHSGEVSSRLGQ